jgi:S-adenosylmethionine decarboxylase
MKNSSVGRRPGCHRRPGDDFSDEEPVPFRDIDASALSSPRCIFPIAVTTILSQKGFGIMTELKKDDFVGRHLIVDASTYTRRNLNSTDTIFSLFEALARNLDMTLVLPPIVCRYPFANDEISAFCDDIEGELERKARDLASSSNKPVDLSLTPIRIMKEFLRRRQIEESGVTGLSIWAESHAAIHTWDEDNYYAFDAFSCKDFRPRDALRLLLSHFDIEMLNCVNLLRFQRSMPKVSNFQVNDNWEVIVDGKTIGELDSVNFNEL